MLLFLNKFKYNLVLLFLAGFIVLSVWEYIVGALLEKNLIRNIGIIQIIF